MLADLQCAVVEATIWTHNGRIASLVHVKDENSGSEIKDLHKIDRIERRLRNVLKGDSDSCRARTTVSMAVTHTERRLHQMMLADVDNEGKLGSVAATEANVSVQDWSEKGYSVVNVRCEDRPKLLFDIVCTLTDMQYVIFHATIDTEGAQASQVFSYLHYSCFVLKVLLLVFLGCLLMWDCFGMKCRNFTSGTWMEAPLGWWLKGSV